MDRLNSIEAALEDLSCRINALDSYRTLLQSDADTILDRGNTSWVMFSSVIVLIMTLPGVGLFYGGLVPSVMSFNAAGLQTLSITCIVTFLWLVMGYSLVYYPKHLNEGNPIVGDLGAYWMSGFGIGSNHVLAPTIPESVFCNFQLMFAIITAALIPGSFTDRMKFSTFLMFIGLWHILVYCPIAHANWHPAGLLVKLGAVDFAGGNVVHIASGTSALVASLMVGKGFGKNDRRPSNIIITVIGGCLLWGGWFGFNAGSALASGRRACQVMLNTQLGAACGGLAWMLVEKWFSKRRTMVGFMCGIISGLVGVTPAAGYVNITGAVITGILSGALAYFGCKFKNKLGIDDSLDAFGIHATAGVVGGLMTGLFAKEEIGGVNGAFYGNPILLGYQVVGILYTVAWSGFISLLILLFLKYTIGIRVKMAFNKVGGLGGLGSPSKNSRGSRSASKVSLLLREAVNETIKRKRSENPSLGSFVTGLESPKKKMTTLDSSGHGNTIITIKPNPTTVYVSPRSPEQIPNSSSYSPRKSVPRKSWKGGNYLEQTSERSNRVPDRVMEVKESRLSSDAEHEEKDDLPVQTSHGMTVLTPPL